MTDLETNGREPERLVIIGSGPAAWTAAIYAARARLDPLVFEGSPSREMIPGGQLMFTSEVENYPGFPEGVDGQTLMMQMRAQAERFQTRVVMEDVVEIDTERRPFKLRTSGGDEVSAHAVIVATEHRLRPILLTAAAAILGMIPIAPTVFWGPMAYAVMGGLVVATLLLLSPAQFPWYATWVLPFAAFFPSWGLLALSATLPIYYASFYYHARDSYDVFRVWWVWAIWLPVWAGLAADAWMAWRGRLEDTHA